MPRRIDGLKIELFGQEIIAEIDKNIETYKNLYRLDCRMRSTEAIKRHTFKNKNMIGRAFEYFQAQEKLEKKDEDYYRMLGGYPDQISKICRLLFLKMYLNPKSLYLLEEKTLVDWGLLNFMENRFDEASEILDKIYEEEVTLKLGRGDPLERSLERSDNETN